MGETVKKSILRCGQCPFVSIGGSVWGPSCYAPRFLKGGTTANHAFMDPDYLFPRVPPEWCPLRECSVEISLDLKEWVKSGGVLAE